jgi:hypothetical protein
MLPLLFPTLLLQILPKGLLFWCFGSGSGSGSRQANTFPPKKKKKEISCLEISLLGWRLLLEPGCPL